MDVKKQNNKNQENANISNFLKNSPQPKINPEPSDNLQKKNYKNQILNEQIRNSNPIISQKYNIPQKESNKILYNSSGDSEKKIFIILQVFLLPKINKILNHILFKQPLLIQILILFLKIKMLFKILVHQKLNILALLSLHNILKQ